MKKSTKTVLWILVSVTIVAGGIGAYLFLAPKDGQTKVKAGKNYTYKKGQGWIDNTVTSAGEYTNPSTAQPKPVVTAPNTGTPIVGTSPYVLAPTDNGLPQYGIPAPTETTKPATVGQYFYTDASISASNPAVVYTIDLGTGLKAFKVISAPLTYVGKVLSIDTFSGNQYAKTYLTSGNVGYVLTSKVHS